ncbi:MAG TPA: FAD:protein FMN transferase [Verrucomicrobiae bacterium]|nr:FAD:protein FMN transferase [Verrucomicrobiae bacterium]
MALIRVARNAMATRFEIVLLGDNPVSLRAAGEEALSEIERLESRLSVFKPQSDIARVNTRAAFEPVRVTPEVFHLLERACLLSRETEGAFDISIAPLVRCWGFMGGTGRLPSAEEIAAARSLVGMQRVLLEPSSLTVRFEREGMMLDLGAIGKGYAIERAVEVLLEAGVSNALLHGGTSTIYGLGRPQDVDAWRIEIPSPAQVDFAATAIDSTPKPASPSGPAPDSGQKGRPFATVTLCDASLSVSAVWGKSFQSRGKSFGHIIDPRTGEPAINAVMSAVVLPSATETDALSTALLTLGPAGHDALAKLRPGIKTLVAATSGDGYQIRAHGIDFEPPK